MSISPSSSRSPISSTNSSPNLSARQSSKVDVAILEAELALTGLSQENLTNEEIHKRIIKALPAGLKFNEQLDVINALNAKYLKPTQDEIKSN